MGAFSLAVLAQTWLEMLGSMVLISTACSGAVWPREVSPSVLSVIGGPPGKGVTASSLDWLPGKEPPNGPHGPQERTSALQSSVLRPPFLKSLVLAD